MILSTPAPAAAGGQANVTYLWHLHQPIYWPDQQQGGADRYEAAWQSIQAKDGGRTHPEDNLHDIFGKDDRRAAYQYRPKDAVGALSGFGNGGAQVSYSGALMENVNSLAGRLYYDTGWQGHFSTANGWKTGGGFPRLDLVNFSFHHALLPLHTPHTVELELRLHRYAVEQNFGTAALSKGFFPTEMAFSERLIPILRRLGIEWAIVSNSHLSRACADYPLVLGTGGDNCDPPNKADQLNPGGNAWFRRTISRGCSPVNAVPFAFRPHQAQFVDPDTGVIEKLIVVPAAQALSWIDGYQCFGLSDMQDMISNNPDNGPLLVVLAHDGDNAFGGGFSYYMECVPNFAGQATGAGHLMTTVEQYLAEQPVSADDVVKVEDGAWVNADSDFGSPIFINWNYPPLSASGQIDIPNGWHEKIREYAIYLAAENRIRTAEAAAGGPAPRLAQIYNPDDGATAVERAWHYYLGSLDSGYVYYGDALDHEVVGTIGCNEAFQHADAVLAQHPGEDGVPPTIWNPQRQPWNPGAVNFGVQYQYKQHINNGDFYVWTFIYDVSGVQRATLYYRVDADGVNPLNSTQNETFAGGSEVGPWQAVPMTGREFAKTNIYNKPGLNYFELPTYIADFYYARITGQRNVLLDYYVEAEDTKGNVERSAIQHVWVGDGQGGTGPGGRVEWRPDPLGAGFPATILYNAAEGPLASAGQIFIHIGFNGWQNIMSPDPAMTWDADEQRWRFDFTVPGNATAVDFVFNNGSGQWDNNDGQDWHAPVSAGPTPTPSPTAIPTPTPDGSPTPTPGPTPTPTPEPSPTPTPGPRVTWQPALLRAGETGVIFYNPNGGPLSGAAQIHIHRGQNNWQSVLDPDPSMTFDSGSGLWRHDFTVPTDAWQIDMAFNDGAGLWDNNNGQDWHAPATGVEPGSRAMWEPVPLVEGRQATIHYDPAGGPLDGASQINIHIGFNGWQNIPSPDPPMILDPGTQRWRYELTIPSGTTLVNFVFNNGADLWDNNSGRDWNVPVATAAVDRCVWLLH
ncbi:MAG: hypothetical protein Kow0059_18520 [Candidatus Sumerlaeia bacterium]